MHPRTHVHTFLPSSLLNYELACCAYVSYGHVHVQRAQYVSDNLVYMCCIHIE